MYRLAVPIALILAIGFPAFADKADVLEVTVMRTGRIEFTFHVKVQHADTGWEHYADAWRVVGPDGTVYGTRSLLHPHVDEQPFTRSLTGVEVPQDVTHVRVESHDNVHGWGGAAVEVEIPKRE